MKTKNLLLLLLPVWMVLSSTKVEADDHCSGYKTYTQGGWGANASGQNAGTYLQSHFAEVFGTDGLSIGSNNKLVLNSANSVNDFLPSGSSAALLPSGTKVNPGSSYRNVLAGQLVALTLNVAFDAFDQGFASTDNKLEDAFITDGKFKNKTVKFFLQIANRAIGGENTGYTLSEINETAASINENFDNGTEDHGYLSCKSENSNEDEGNGGGGVVYNPLVVNLSISSFILCHGDHSGAISTSINGGLAPYAYVWSNGSQSANLSNLVAGSYSLEVTDARGTKSSASIVLDEPTELTAMVSGHSLTCHESANGSASVLIAGGVAPYSVSWSNGASEDSVFGLSAGSYVVAITDAHGCSAAASILITEPDLLVASATSTNVFCHGGNDGSAYVNATGGTTPYTFAWSNGETTQALSSLAPGTYVATVTDANGCTAFDTVVIDQPELLEVTAIAKDASCYGNVDGYAIASIKGGVAPYTISWSNGAETDSIGALAAGTYVVSVQDAHGCGAATSVIVGQPSVLAATTQLSQVTCFGSNNGTAKIHATGGTAPYQYFWSNGSVLDSVSGLAPGNYNVLVTDAHQCSYGTEFTITQPDLLKIDGITVTNVTCPDGRGTATVSVSGGTAPYSYSWIGQGEQSSPIASLPYGTTSLVVTDAHGCTATGSATLALLTFKNFTTVTPGGWGAKANGSNWGTYRDAHFNASFPTGLTVGENGKFLTLTSSSAVAAFLPSGGTPAALKVGTAVNPTSSTLKNTLAGHTVTLTLTTTFDSDNAGFSVSTGLLKDMVVASGTFKGWSVAKVLAEANKVLGGSSIYTASDMTNVLTAINQSYEEDGEDHGFLVSPCTNIAVNKTDEDVQKETTRSENREDNLISVDQNSVYFKTKKTSKACLSVYDQNGKLLLTLFNGEVKANEGKRVEFNREGYKAGVYVVRLTTDSCVTNVKVVK